MDSQNKLLQELNLLITAPHWDKLDNYLAYLVEAQHTALASADTIEAVKEAQGRLKAYQLIRALPNTIRSMKDSGIRN